MVQAEPRFHIFIDEAGDPGVKQKSGEEPDWTDWFVISAVVMDAHREQEANEWIAEMNQAIRRNPPASIHFRNLSDANRRHVCRVMAEKPLRIFVVASHKTSMRRHVSKRLGVAKAQDFYNWCVRLLLERVTEWCAGWSRQEGRDVQPARIVFSEKGGHDYGELRDYLRKLQAQTLTGNLTLDRKGITLGVMRDDLIEVIGHNDLAGLQLADIAASAFFQAACSPQKRHTVEFATKLMGRVARQGRRKFPDRFGLMLLPFPHQGQIPVADRRIFELGGYRFPKA
ncbi:DUF3800 domain-containing protein [Novosphingobium sp. 9]|uniref:DUF3800 domain-containing protein n=1 Tax=Novosphingobium sp. 9 TaxID=2025349 RepID=UPI0021B5D748|nr:DUF3800 domain-containing protein [Novosphingobium sp. 9]